VELVGEVGWLWWQRGEYARAFGALRGALFLLDNCPQNQARRRQTLWKLGHVLGWMLNVALRGTPPATNASGDVYTPPYSGLISRFTPELEEKPMPDGEAPVWFQLAMFGVGIGRTRSSHELLNRLTKDPSVAENGLLAEAVANTRAGIDAWIADPRAAVNAVNTSKDQTYVDWQMFVAVTAPTFLLALTYDALKPRVQALDGLAEAIRNRNAVDPNGNWLHAVGALRQALLASTRSEVQMVLDAVGNGVYEQWMLYLALTVVPDAVLPQCVSAHAVCLKAMEDRSTLGDIAKYQLIRFVIRFWRTQAEISGFRLSSPASLRAVVDDVGDELANPPLCARVLLAANQAVGSTLNADIRQYLIGLASPLVSQN